MQHPRGTLLQQVGRMGPPALVKVGRNARGQPAPPLGTAEGIVEGAQRLLQPGTGRLGRAHGAPGDQQVDGEVPGQHGEQRGREQVHPVRVADAVDGQAQQQRGQRQATRHTGPQPACAGPLGV